MAAAKDRFPSQIKYIIGNEACERFSFYGMRTILTVFMVSVLAFEKQWATEVYHLFVAACYLAPLGGAYIADRFWGKYKTIFWLSLVYCAGHAVLAIWENETGLYAGLALIAVGSGGIKPCVSAFVGDQFTKSQSHLISKAYSAFYFSINFGSFFSTLLTPWLLKNYGPSIAFGIPGVLMFIATIIFWAGRDQYRHVPPVGANPNTPMKVILSAFRGTRKKNGDFLSAAEKKHPKSAVEATRAVLSVVKIFVFSIPVFWALFDQHGSTWVLQAQQMDPNFMGMTLLPSSLQALNPIMVMALIPIFTFLIYPTMGKFFEVTLLRKMKIGMFIAGLAFAEVGVIQYILDSGAQLNMAWQFFPYLTITIAEVMVSVTGLEFAYTQAPATVKSTIMSFWLLTVFLGNMIVIAASRFGLLNTSGEGSTFDGGFYMFFAGLMICAALLFIFLTRNYQLKNFVGAKK